MKLDTRHSFLVAVIRLGESSRRHFNTIYLSGGGSHFTGQHFEVILEHIDDFIGLQGFFNSVSNFVNELIKFFFHSLIVFEVTEFTNEVVRVVLSRLVDTSSKVGLSLDVLNAVSCLEASFHDVLLMSGRLDVFDLTLAIYEVFTCIFVHEVETILAKFLPRSRDSHGKSRS